ncbi:MAG: mercury(II) reductase [Thermoplasmataceae archaeon]
MNLGKNFDLVIIGRGAAAFSAAIKASELTSGQASIAMIGYGPIGGTCVNVGCVPSKYLIESAKVVHTQSNPRYPGIGIANSGLNFRTLMGSLREAVNEEIRTKYSDVVQSYGNITVFDGKASFVDESTVLVNGNDGAETISGFNFIIATGSSPMIKEIKGLAETGFLTSETIWNIDMLPQTLAVIGGGFIGLELGQALSRLGSTVKIVKEHKTVTAGIEPELGGALLSSLAEEGIQFLTERKIIRVLSRNGKKVLVTKSASGTEEVEADEILLASGRFPNISSLGLEKAGVNYSRNGIYVNDQLATSNPNIYAAGDVVDQKYKLETLAAREGATVATNIYNHEGTSIPMDQVPWAVFTEPQFASVGFTESEYSEKFGKPLTRTVRLESVPKARILRNTKGAFKIVADAQTGKIVGVHAVSPYAAEFIIEGVYAIKFGLTYEKLIENSHVFPTVAEGIKLTAQSFTRDISKMSCCME